MTGTRLITCGISGPVPGSDYIPVDVEELRPLLQREAGLYLRAASSRLPGGDGAGRSKLAPMLAGWGRRRGVRA